MKSLFVYLLEFFVVVFGDRCCEIGSRESPMYKLAKHGRRSTKTIISRKNVSNLQSCEKFAISKKALAFNYGKTTVASYHGQDGHWKDSNCEALDCPVLNDFTIFSNDTRFDYYTIYRLSQISPAANASLKCLPSVGIFYISEDRLNYTNALESCRTVHGTLAHVGSEERTEGLGKIINDVPTFVGLSNRDNERLWKNEFDEPLSCFDYRGWAEHEPANSRGCVVLVRPNNSRSSSTWKVFPCSRKSPYICEIMPRPRTHKKRPKELLIRSLQGL